MMITNRRTLLQGAFLLPLIAKANGLRPAFAAQGPRPLIITVAGIDGSADVVALSEKIEPFLRRKLPLTITVDPFDGDGDPLGTDSRLAAWLRQLHRNNRDHIEFGIHVKELRSDDPFDQARHASEAQAAFLKLVNVYEDYADKAIVMGRTMTTAWVLDDGKEGAAMRAAGIRSVLHLPSSEEGTTDAATRWEATSTGLVHIQAPAGAGLLDGRSRQSPPAASIEGDFAGPPPLVLDLLGQLDAASDLEAEERLASDAEDLAHSAILTLVRPSDLAMPDGSTPQRLVVVRVDDFRLSPEQDRAHKAFVEELIAAGYPVSDAVIPGPDKWRLSQDAVSAVWLKTMANQKGYELAVHGWSHSKDELAGNSFLTDKEIVQKGARELYHVIASIPMTYVPPNNAFDENTLDAIAATGMPVFSAELSDFRYCQAVDKRGTLHASNTVSFEVSWDGDLPYFSNNEVDQLFGAQNDAVLMIHPQTANTPAKRKQILDMLARLDSEPGTKLVSFGQYRKEVLPPMPLVERIQSARRKVWIEDAHEPTVDASETSALMRDAELAWRYFEWGAAEFDGVAPGTADRVGDKLVGYPFVTMWDVGSQILATISAHRLGLIDQKQFEAGAAALIQFLGKRNYMFGGVRLPPTEVGVGGRQAQHGGFDSADTGRLLIALKTLDKYVDGSLPIEGLVRSWGLEKTLPGGELHDIVNGRLSSTQENSYTPYAQRGFALWGYDVTPVFDARDQLYDMKDAVRTLREIKERGRIATEPLVTEEIELGGSQHGRFAADILYSAQIERYEATGKLTCASETAIEQSPYFTYQGYQINETGGDFVVDLPSRSQRKRSAKQDDALRAVNSKGAYLWYAARPGHYSDALIKLIREEARLEGLGFTAGVHEANGEPVGVSEINTNAVILEAIDYILNGRTPLLRI